MPRTCFICWKTYVPKNLSFHRFPKSLVTCSAWKEACQLPQNSDVSNLKICSDHFKPEDYIDPSAKLKGSRVLTLKTGVVPSRCLPQNSVSTSVELSMQNEIAYIKGSTLVIMDEHEVPVVSSTLECYDKTTDMFEEDSFSEHNYALTADSLVPDTIHEEESVDVVTTPKRKRKFVNPHFISEVESPDVATPRKARRSLAFIKGEDKKKSEKIKSLQKKHLNLKRCDKTLKGLVKSLKNRCLITEDVGNHMKDMLPPQIKEMLNRKLKSGGKFSPELRSFALTLNVYSPKAYSLVRRVWPTLLPHPSTIRRFFHKSKQFGSKTYVRHKYHKLILFNNQ